MKQPGFFDIDDRLKALSAKGDALEKLSGLVDFDADFSQESCTS